MHDDILVGMKSIFHPSVERGKGDYGWLTTRYSFSFSNWYDPTKMGFGALRVLNDDVIASGQGFGTHGHKDMEIITIVMRGAVAHKDSMGNEYVVNEGDVQVMSAGTGVMHSEHNASQSKPLELFQLWIEPYVRGVETRYEQKNYNFQSVTNTLVELVGANSLLINQDSYILYGSLENEGTLSYQLHGTGNGVYFFVIEGSLTIGSQVLEKRDAFGVWGTKEVEITSQIDSTFLVIEVPLE